MAHYLVIVESPAKVKTIKKFLGSNYTVAASQGHVRDLPKSSLGIDVEHDYEPKYITIRGKGDILAALRKEAKKSDKVFLATDPDREGEAISWHLATALKLDEKKMRRITFNEITKNAVKASLKAPRDIDMNLVDAQQARRVLDRMVGYRISPLLWAKVKRGLSAGRVQSVALRLVADREEEINAFIPEEYWTLDVILKIKGEKRPLTAKFYGTDQKKMEEALQSLSVDGFKTEITRVKKSGLDACDFNVILDHAHENHDHDMEYLHGHDHDMEHDHDHEHHHHHHADEVFTSWGMETIVPVTKDQLEDILKRLAETKEFGDVLRAKGMLPTENPGEWLYFDLVPEQYEIRDGKPDYTGKVCVIGASLKEEELNKVFGRG